MSPSTEPTLREPARKLVLRILLVFLVLTALIAIVDIWTDIDEDGRILASSFVISMASLLGLTGAAQIDRAPRAPIGLATLTLAGLSALLSLALIWGTLDGSEMGKVVVSAWLWSISTSLHCLLGLSALPEDKRWLGRVAPILTYAATAFSTALIFGFIDGGETSRYVLATLYILATLASLAVLIMHLMHRHGRHDGSEGALILIPVAGEVYRDPASARHYRVIPVE